MEVFFKTPLFWMCLNTSGGVLRRHEGDPPMGALPPPPLLLPLLSFPLLPPPLPSHRLLLHFAGLLSLPSLEILPLYGGRSLSSYSHNPSPSGPPVNKYFERGCSPHLLPYRVSPNTRGLNTRFLCGRWIFHPLVFNTRDPNTRFLCVRRIFHPLDLNTRFPKYKVF